MSAARRGWGPGKPGPRRSAFRHYTTMLTAAEEGRRVTDYRGFFESQLADVENRRAALDSERDEILAVLKRLDAADAAMSRKAPTPEKKVTARTTVQMPAGIIGVLNAAGQMLTAEEIYNGLSNERDVPRAHLYSALHRLKKRGKVFKADNRWGLVGRDDKADEPSGPGQSTLLTPPSEPRPQPAT